MLLGFGIGNGIEFWLVFGLDRISDGCWFGFVVHFVG